MYSTYLLKSFVKFENFSILKNKNTLIHFLKENFRILVAISLIDMKTRYGSSMITYLVAIAYPLAHIGVIVTSYLIRTKIAPLGEDPTVFVSSGVLPYILTLYPGRMMAMAVLGNKNLLILQIIKPIHLIFAKAIVEILTGLSVCIIFYTILLIIGLNFVPINPPLAAGAIFASIYMGVSFGLINALLTSIVGTVAFYIYIGFMLSFYFTSGAIIPYQMMPAIFLEYAPWNPIFNLVQWFRSSYYIVNDDGLYSISYILLLSSICLAIGLAGERFMRGKYVS